MGTHADLGKAHLRVVRESDDLAPIVAFYRDGLGFAVLYEFRDHEGFDGVFLGHTGAAYHLAFVHKVGNRVGRAPTEDNLLVFYVPDAEEWQRGVRRLEELGHKHVKSFNPYWDRNGKTFEDPDGYRVVLQHASWPTHAQGTMGRDRIDTEGTFRPRRPGLQSRVWREMTRLGTRYTIDPELPVEVRRRRLLLLNRFFLLPSGTRVTPVVASGVPAEWVVPLGADSRAVLLYLHGGAYVAGSPATHRVFVARLAKAVGARALVPDYRLAPEHRFPCAVEDAVAVYAWLVGEQGVDPARVVVAGDSAGGGLTLALAVSVRDSNGKLPRALACISPWTDLAGTGESMRTRARFDPWYQPDGLALEARRYLGDADPKHPLASPLYANLRDLPPLLVQVGEDEVLLDDSRRLVQRAFAAGVDATLEMWPRMWHIFQMQGTFPESRQAEDRFGRFLQRHLATRIR